MVYSETHPPSLHNSENQQRTATARRQYRTDTKRQGRVNKMHEFKFLSFMHVQRSFRCK
uniref:Uncharacterized protein n=1 Tax=Anguilla anguilla TaxID=7936 RepID=A0A0E9SMA3_ANGAN